MPQLTKKIHSETAGMPDRLLTFREVNERLGLACKTSHTVRAMARRGQLEIVRLNSRVLRVRESSCNRLIAGVAA